MSTQVIKEYYLKIALLLAATFDPDAFARAGSSAAISIEN